MSKVYIFFADGFEDIEGLTVVDLMRRAGIDIQTVSVKETKEIRMEKGKPYPLGWTENADGSINLAAVLERNKECGVLLYPRRGGAPRRLAFREEDRIGKICCMKLIGLDEQEYEYYFYCG